MVQVTASDGRALVTRPFPMIVKADAPRGPIPAAPRNVTVRHVDGGTAVQVDWDRPADVAVAAYAIYRDGALWSATAADVTTFVDRERIVENQFTRYHVSLFNTDGAESMASETVPPIVTRAGLRQE
jgi:hypothetical protein